MKLERYAQLTQFLAGMACENLVEVGTWNGRRAEELAPAALRRNHAVTYHGFDLFEALTDEELDHELSKRPLSQREVEARLRRFQRRILLTSALRPWRRRVFDFALHQGYTRVTLSAFANRTPNFSAEFIFIDGGHRRRFPQAPPALRPRHRAAHRLCEDRPGYDPRRYRCRDDRA
jgi:hypothetical protein